MSSFAPIAIVGRACVLPEALSPDALWERVVDGTDLISTVPNGRWKLDQSDVLCSLVGDSTDRSWADRGGYVRGFDDVFDPDGFAIGSDELVGLDPVVLWTLHTARAALRDAGHLDTSGADIGAVFGNLSFPTAGMAEFAQSIHLGDVDSGAAEPDARNRFMSGLPALLLERALELGQGAMALDAACASSLYAIKLACDRLHDGDASIMLAGAVNCADDLFIHQGFTALNALSPTGQSRPFHPDADGLVPAEGCGFVVLRRLRDAVRDGDTIHGIIRGVGLSNDGRGRGMLAPSSNGQVRAMRTALDLAGLQPTDISLLECHATGTKVGDATEIESSAEVYADCDGLPIGSLKSNTGHLITAAGVAGVIKVLGAMEHEVRPPTLHVESTISALDDSPFRVLAESETWQRSDAPDGVLRAGVSAFGFGGNNAHLILEEPSTAAALLAAIDPATPDTAHERVDDQGHATVAVVGIGVNAAGAVGRSAVTDAVLANLERVDGDGAGRIPDIELRLAAQKFPPNDLQAALSQQLVMLQVADEALAECSELPTATTGIYVGMGADPEATRFGTRWRLAAGGEFTGAALAAARDRVGPALTAAGVLGTMPNLVANRLNSQYDATGPSFTVSSEEHSGIDAVDLASRALRAGEIDAALVGAVDLTCNDVHTAATTALLPRRGAPGDAAVMLVLKRLDDAEAAGDTVYAVLPASGSHGASRPAAADIEFGGDATDEPDSVTRLFGHSHAAIGLVRTAVAALCLHHRVCPGDAPLIATTPIAAAERAPGAGPRTALVSSTAMDGRNPRALLLAEATDHLAPSRLPAPKLHVFSGTDSTAVLADLAERRESTDGAARLVIVADSDHQFVERAARAEQHVNAGKPAGSGVHFAAAPIDGELGFVFTAGGAAYHGMGAQLFRALPETLASISERVPLGDVAQWVFGPEREPAAADYLWGTALLSQAHAAITLGLLGLRPSAAIGYSSGETNSLFAFGVWSDMDAMRRQIDATGMLDREIAVDFDAVARAWGVDDPDWAVWNVLAPVDDVRAAIADEARVHLMLINTERDVVISGDAAACTRIVEHFGSQRCRSVGYNLACHVPELAAEFHQQWLDVHTREVTPVPGVRFYSNGVEGAYDVSTEACAATITKQAETTVDFPATIRAAYADGVRVFVEHGPSGACTNFIREILGDDVLAVHLDRRDSNVEQLFEACAALVAVGIDVDHAALTARLEQRSPVPEPLDGPVMRFAAHPAPVQRTARALTAHQTMPPAPQLPPVLGASPDETSDSASGTAGAAGIDAAAAPAAILPTQAPGPVPASSPAAAVLSQELATLASIHEAFVAQQAAIHQQFLATRHDAFDLLLGASGSAVPAAAQAAAAGVQTASVAPVAPIVAEPAVPRPVDQPVSEEPVAVVSAPPSGRKRTPVGPAWNKQQLQIHSSGRISDLFGPMFEPQDEHTLQCRMPEPPLLLADRVTGLDAEPGVLGVGTIWTETDVERGAWYLNDGYMPAGFMIESGQADLMLISYMGIDLLNRGERAYRLLGCTLTYHGDLPSVGETLEYEIRITGHARHGDIRLFFFEYDCEVAGQPRLTVRDAQAGFFNQQELDEALGALWTPESGRAELRDDARVDPPLIDSGRRSFSADEVRAFSEGRVVDCFGPAFEWTATHTRTPSIQAGDHLFIDEVTDFDPAGGPWGRGFMRCEAAIADDAWFFDGHFKNDPCMPGNFMVESCIEAMSFYLAALGHTTRRDGWRFQPLPEQPFELKCRGEINPQTERVAYELYVEEIWDGPHPTIICDVLGFVDGKPAFHAHRIGVELVPSWPLTSMPEVWEGVVEPLPVATDAAGFPFDWKAMVSCAWGDPSDAFGSMYDAFDRTRRSPRLPGPPYHFISRVTEIIGELDDCKAGLEIVCEYDIPDDAWYFDENGAETMPFAVLLEAALQPCGWVASAVGSANHAEDDLLFRNLDGTGTLIDELTRTSGTLSTHVKLTSVSQAAGMIVEGFDVECSIGGRVVYTMNTVFGFFPPAAFEDQVGLPVAPDDAVLLEALPAPGDSQWVDLTNRPDAYCAGSARLAGEMLLMLDRVSRFDGAGQAGLGTVVGEKDVDISEWFFKAHFFQDPVQPGSLGVEALLQLLQFHMLDTGMADEMDGARFEPMLLGAPMVWKYRGQVTPKNAKITTTMEITETGSDDLGPYVIGAGSLWCDGLRIYEVSNMGMRLVSDAPGPAAPSSRTSQQISGQTGEQRFGPTEFAVAVSLSSHPQLMDHTINGTPVVPVVFVVEWLTALATAHRPDLYLLELSDVRVLSGLTVDGYYRGTDLDVVAVVSPPVEHDAPAGSGGEVRIALELRDQATGRTHYRATALLGASAPTAPVLAEDQPTPSDEPWTGDIYFGDVLFHGPAFRVLEEIDAVSDTGLRARSWGMQAVGWPKQTWSTDAALLDGALQLALLWTERQLGARSLPTAIGSVRLYSAPLAGQHTMSLVGRRATAHMVVCDVVVRSASGDVVAVLDGIETHALAAAVPGDA